MSSEQNDSTSFSHSEPKLCVNGCGFFGTAANMDLCSKCYQDLRITDEQTAAAKAALENSLNPEPKFIETTISAESTSSRISVGAEMASFSEQPPPQQTMRCLSCNKKVGLMGFKCKCGSTFCGSHRYPENHECKFDFKGEGRDAIAEANPVVKPEKVERI